MHTASTWSTTDVRRWFHDQVVDSMGYLKIGTFFAMCAFKLD